MTNIEPFENVINESFMDFCFHENTFNFCVVHQCIPHSSRFSESHIGDSHEILDDWLTDWLTSWINHLKNDQQSHMFVFRAYDHLKMTLGQFPVSPSIYSYSFLRDNIIVGCNEKEIQHLNGKLDESVIPQ